MCWLECGAHGNFDTGDGGTRERKIPLTQISRRKVFQMGDDRMKREVRITNSLVNELKGGDDTWKRKEETDFSKFLF